MTGRARDATLALGNQRWPALDGRRPLLLVPVGSVEQHGPHLPQSTDSLVATAMTYAAAERLSADGEDVLVAPVVSYGASGEHEGFPGTVSIGEEVLGCVLVEIGRSACRWARGVIFVNGHGGNTPTVAAAVQRLRFEGRAVAWTTCEVSGGDAHAGDTETSLLRHLAPSAVRVDLAECGATEPLGDLMPRLISDGVRAVSANGVLGDPTRSSAERGRDIFTTMVRSLVLELRLLDVADSGRLRGRVHEVSVSPP